MLECTSIGLCWITALTSTSTQAACRDWWNYSTDEHGNTGRMSRLIYSTDEHGNTGRISWLIAIQQWRARQHRPHVATEGITALTSTATQAACHDWEGAPWISYSTSNCLSITTGNPSQTIETGRNASHTQQGATLQQYVQETVTYLKRTRKKWLYWKPNGFHGNGCAYRDKLQRPTVANVTPDNNEHEEEAAGATRCNGSVPRSRKRPQPTHALRKQRESQSRLRRASYYSKIKCYLIEIRNYTQLSHQTVSKSSLIRPHQYPGYSK